MICMDCVVHISVTFRSHFGHISVIEDICMDGVIHIVKVTASNLLYFAFAMVVVTKTSAHNVFKELKNATTRGKNPRPLTHDERRERATKIVEYCKKSPEEGGYICEAGKASMLAKVKHEMEKLEAEEMQLQTHKIQTVNSKNIHTLTTMQGMVNKMLEGASSIDTSCNAQEQIGREHADFQKEASEVMEGSLDEVQQSIEANDKLQEKLTRDVENEKKAVTFVLKQ